MGHQGTRGSWGKAWPAGRSRYVCPRHRWGKTGECGDSNATWSVACVPHREAGALHLGEGSLFHFKVAGQGMDAMSLIWPEPCPLRNGPRHEFFPEMPLSQEQDVRLRELLRPEERGCPAPGPACPSPTRGSGYSWGAGERAKSLQPPPQRPSLLWRWGLGLSSTEAGQDSVVLFIGFIWR